MVQMHVLSRERGFEAPSIERTKAAQQRGGHSITGRYQSHGISCPARYEACEQQTG